MSSNCSGPLIDLGRLRRAREQMQSVAEGFDDFGGRALTVHDFRQTGTAGGTCQLGELGIAEIGIDEDDAAAELGQFVGELQRHRGSAHAALGTTYRQERHARFQQRVLGDNGVDQLSQFFSLIEHGRDGVRSVDDESVSGATRTGPKRVLLHAKNHLSQTARGGDLDVVGDVLAVGQIRIGSGFGGRPRADSPGPWLRRAW